MSNGDYGYFGKGDTGYAQYMAAGTAVDGGCLIAIAVVVVLILIVLGG